MKLHTAIERWPLNAPFRISGYTWEFLEVLVVHLEAEGCLGRAETTGVYYKADTPTGMLRQVESVRG